MFVQRYNVHAKPFPPYPSVEVLFDDQCDITWYIPKGVEPLPLFQTTSFNIERESLDLIGGEDGKTFRFLVSIH